MRASVELADVAEYSFGRIALARSAGVLTDAEQQQPQSRVLRAF
jgi:hypothetical protein